MKFSIPLSLLMTCTAIAVPPAQESIPTVLGPKAYRVGDAIEITEVTATSPHLEQGDSVTVSGKFYLKSQESANLCLFLTQTEGDGKGNTQPSQKTLVRRGNGDFTLKTTIRNRGHLHLTYYDPASGKPFGGTYFGTAEQMKSIANWDVSYYLASEKGNRSSNQVLREIEQLRQKVRAIELRLENLEKAVSKQN